MLIHSGFLIDIAVMVVQSCKVIRKKFHKEHMLELVVTSTRLEESSKAVEQVAISQLCLVY